MALRRRMLWQARNADAVHDVPSKVGPESRAGALREAADRARGEQIWWLDARCRRLLCERPEASAGDWLQYGHSLKEDRKSVV